MILRDQGVERRGAEDDLLAVGGPQPGPAGKVRGRRLGSGWLVLRHLEESGLLDPGPLLIM